MNALNFLRIPLSMIEHIADPAAFQGLSPQQLALLQRDYTPEEIRGIRAALQFAVEHPQHDFAAMLPGLSHSNERIHRFLVKVASSLQGQPGAANKSLRGA